MKRIITVVLGLFLLAGSIVGCGGVKDALQEKIGGRQVIVPGSKYPGERWQIKVYFEQTATEEQKQRLRDFVDEYVADKQPEYLSLPAEPYISVFFNMATEDRIPISDEIYDAAIEFKVYSTSYAGGWSKRPLNYKPEIFSTHY